MVTRRQLTLGLSIAGLIVLTLVFDVGMMCWMPEGHHMWRWMNDAFSGVLLAQVILVGMYLGLGRGGWYVRTGISVSLTLVIARTVGIAAMLIEDERRNGEPDIWAALSFLFIPMMLAAGLIGLMFQRFRGWQLSWQPCLTNVSGRQFQISDIMIWTTLIAGALAAIKFLATFDEHLEDQFLELSLLTARTTVAVISGMLVAFAPVRAGRKALLISVVLAAATGLLSLSNAYNTAWPVFVISSAIEEISHHEAFAFAAAIWSGAFCFVLRSLGCRFVRPSVATPNCQD